MGFDIILIHFNMKARFYFSCFPFFLLWGLKLRSAVTVFRDYNGNGQKEANESLVTGCCIVKAHNASGCTQWNGNNGWFYFSKQQFLAVQVM